jgi:quercetin dioxygenase-like cupin family protein
MGLTLKVPAEDLPNGCYISNFKEVRPFLADDLVDHLGPPVGKGIIKILLPQEAVGSPNFDVDWVRIPRGGGVVDHHHRADGRRELYIILKGSLRMTIDGTDHMLGEGDLAYFGPEVMHGFVCESPEAEYLSMGVPARDVARTDDVIEMLAGAGIEIREDGRQIYSEPVVPEGHADRR